MDDETLRLECLKMALQKCARIADAMEEADRLFAHIKGRSDPHPKARVVGVNDQLDRPFDDYVKE